MVVETLRGYEVGPWKVTIGADGAVEPVQVALECLQIAFHGIFPGKEQGHEVPREPLVGPGLPYLVLVLEALELLVMVSTTCKRTAL